MAEVHLTEGYAPRWIRFLELWEPGDWRVKVYGITHKGEAPRTSLIEAAKRVALQQFTHNAPRRGHYHTGFVVVHDGRGANMVLVDWWANENELHHHAYVSPPDQPDSLVYGPTTGPSACVWDLKVIESERQAWIDTVLNNPDGPDIEAYLTRRIEGMF